MSCSDSSSSIVMRLDNEENFISFDFAKITCGQEIASATGYENYCSGKSLQEIFAISYNQAQKDLNLQTEEQQFILYLEWDALRSTIAQYLGMEDIDVDMERSQIIAIEHSEEGVEVALVIFPPQEMPKIISCGHSVKYNTL